MPAAYRRAEEEPSSDADDNYFGRRATYQHGIYSCKTREHTDKLIRRNEADIAPHDKRKQEAYEAAQAHHDALFDELCNTPATTMEGIVAKLETWQRIEMWRDSDSGPLDEIDLEARAAVSALRDARRLTES